METAEHEWLSVMDETGEVDIMVESFKLEMCWVVAPRTLRVRMLLSLLQGLGRGGRVAGADAGLCATRRSSTQTLDRAERKGGSRGDQ